MNAYTYSMPAGIPGVVNRLGGRMPEIEAQVSDPINPVAAYGLAGQIDSVTQNFRKIAATDVAIYGFLVRPYPTSAFTAAGFSGSIPLGTAVAPPNFGTIDVLKSGRMTVTLQGGGTAIKGGLVYIKYRDTLANGLPVGGIEAAATADTFALPSTSYFMGGSDGSNNVEIAFNI